MSYINKILKEWSYRVDEGMPNPKNEGHLWSLRSILLEWGWDISAVNHLVYILREGKDKDKDIVRADTVAKAKALAKPGQYWSGNHEGAKVYGPKGSKKDAFDKLKPDKKKARDTQKQKADLEKKRDDAEQARKDREEQIKNTPPVTEAGIDDLDGDAKDRVMNGKDQPPGTESSGVSEIGTGYAMACLDEFEPFDDKVDECLQDRLNKTKVGKKYATDQKDKIKKRKQMIRAAKRERQRTAEAIKNHNETAEAGREMNPKTTTVSHVGGTKKSLQDTVDKLEAMGVTRVNGIPFDPDYKKIILEGGAGENPTDTLVVMVDKGDEKNPKDPPVCIINHTSNKMTSADTQANSGPQKELKTNTKRAQEILKDPYARLEAEKAENEAAANIRKHRNDQKTYVKQYSGPLGSMADDPDSVDVIFDRLMNGQKDGSDPEGISDVAGSYMKVVLGRLKNMKVLDTNKLKFAVLMSSVDKKNRKPKETNNLKAALALYLKKLKEQDIHDPDANPPVKVARADRMTGDDIKIISRLMSDNNPPGTKGQSLIDKRKTKPSGEPKPMTKADLKSYEKKQTEELNNHRKKLNEIGQRNGQGNVGDRVYVDNMISRLHLNIAGGHSPGGIPSDNFELIHGEYEPKDLMTDSKGNLYQKVPKVGGKWYKVDENGSVPGIKPDGTGTPTGKPLDKQEAGKLNEYDCAVIGNPEVHRHCLGVKEGEKLEDGYNIIYTEIDRQVGASGQVKESFTAIIYDRNGRKIAEQTLRSKGGPGDAVNDTIAWSPEYQRCMAKYTQQNGLCG